MHTRVVMTPVMYLDPSGEFAGSTIIITSLIIALCAGGWELTMQYTEWSDNGSEGNFWNNVDWFGVGIEAVSAGIFTALTMISLGSYTAASTNWYLYSRLGLSGTTSILRGINNGDSFLNIMGATAFSLITTLIFVKAGAKPMTHSILDCYSGYEIVAPLIGIQLGKDILRGLFNHIFDETEASEPAGIILYDYGV